MVIPININQEDLISQFNISTKEIEEVSDRVVKEVAAAFYVKWQEEAMQSLSSTRDRYINNLRLVDSGRMEGAIILDYTKDKLIPMIEEGASAFDMKEGFANSDKRKIKKDGGWYLTVPFNIKAPGGEVSGAVNVLPSEVHQIIQQKPINPSTNRSAGLGKSEIPEQYAIPKVRAAIVIPESQAFAEYQHKASTLQGVYRQQDSVTGQSSYGSFRRVSDKSDDNSWIFPGMEAKNLAEVTMSKFENNMQNTLSTALDNALGYFGF